MDEAPTREQLISLVESLCEIQDRILPQWGKASEIQRNIATKFEPLKAPMFYLWERLGYGDTTDLSSRGIDRYWLASCNASPLQFMAECVRKLRTFDIPVNEYDTGHELRQHLINFYSDLIELYEAT